MPWAFRCFFACRAFAPSRVFPQARLDCVASLCHVFCVFAYLSGPLYPSRRKCAGDRLHTRVIISIRSCGQQLWRGSGWFQAFLVLESCVFRQLPGSSVCVESLCHVFSVLLTFQLSISLLLDSPIGFVLQIIENVRSIICEWVHAMGGVLFLFLALYSLSRVRSVAHWHEFPSSVRLCCMSLS